MKTIEVKLRTIDDSRLLGVYADEADCSTVVEEDTLVKCGDQIVLGYVANMGGDLGTLRSLLSRHKFQTGARGTSKMKAMKTQSSVFGYQPRSELRNKACRIAGMAVDNATLHSCLMGWTDSVAKFYRSMAPEAAALHAAETESKVLENYQIGKTMFTSGIVNKSNRLPYHYDSGNYKGAWSAMLGITDGIDGGYLNVPEYDLALKISDGSLSFFDGQARIHGVTKFTRQRADAERYTIVWYSLQKLWNCLTHREEIALMNSRSTLNNRKKSGGTK